MSDITDRILKYGCSNHGCVIEPVVGMGTNAICKCVDEFAETRSGRARLRQLLAERQQWKADAERLREAIRRNCEDCEIEHQYKETVGCTVCRDFAEAIAAHDELVKKYA